MIRKTLSLIGVLCVSTFLLTDANATGKPDKPGKPGKSNTEVIRFVGDLNGDQPVEGCCPNAGPFPEYTMVLSEYFVAFLSQDLVDLLGDYYGVEDIDINDVDVSGSLDGNLFINSYSVGKTEQGYKVQFWFDYEYISGNPVRVFIEIRGGEIINYNRKTQELTVVFTPENCCCLGVCVGDVENHVCKDYYSEDGNLPDCLNFVLDKYPAD